MDFCPGKGIGDLVPVLGGPALVALHKVTVDVGSGLRCPAVIGVGKDQRLVADGGSNLLDQAQPTGVVGPPVEHHAIDGPGFHRSRGLPRHLAAELGIVEVEAEEATFVPSWDSLFLLVSQPPFVPFGEMTPVRIPVADLGDQDEIGIRWIRGRSVELDCPGRPDWASPARFWKNSSQRSMMASWMVFDRRYSSAVFPQ